MDHDERVSDLLLIEDVLATSKDLTDSFRPRRLETSKLFTRQFEQGVNLFAGETRPIGGTSVVLMALEKRLL